MNFTNWLRLKKPLRSEKYLVSIVNENSDLLDNAFYENDEKHNELESKITQNQELLSDMFDNHTSNNDVHFTTSERLKLKNIETGAEVNTVIGIKGDNETSFRIGNVNLTAENVGADPKGSASSALEEAKEYAISKESIDVENGVAPLDENRKIPSVNIPFGTTIDTVMDGATGEELKTDIGILNDSVSKHIQDNDIHFTVYEREKLSGISNNANNYTHPTSTVNIGSYTKTTVDEYGHVVSGSNPTTLEGYGIVDAESKGTANDVVSTHNTSTSAHNDIRILISELTTKLNNFLDVDDSTKDQLSEVLELIENNKDTLESITTGKVNVSDIINNLTTNVATKPLSSAQGVVIKGLIDALQAEIDSHISNHAPNDAEKNTIEAIQKNGTDLTINSSTRTVNITVPTKTSELINDSNYLTSHQDISGKLDKTGDTMSGTLNMNSNKIQISDTAYLGANGYDKSIFLCNTDGSQYVLFNDDIIFFAPTWSSTGVGCVDLGGTSYKWNNIYANNSIIQTSDERLKKDIAELESNLTKDFIMKLKPVSFKMEDGTSGRTHYGLIAQDVEKTLDDLNMSGMDFAGFIKSPTESSLDGEVSEYDYLYSLRYDEFIAPLIKMVQMQQSEIDALKEENQLIKNQLLEINNSLNVSQ